MIYNILVILVVLISLQLLNWIMNRQYTLKSIYNNFLLFLKYDFKKISKSKNQSVRTYIKLIKSMLFFASVLLFFIMASSGFLPFIFMSTSLSGLALIIHITAAPLFCLSYAIFIVLSAFQYMYDEDDYIYIFKRKMLRKSGDIKPVQSLFLLKSTFWISAAISLPVIGSIILSLYPIFSTSEMDILLIIHKYSVLIFTISFVIQVYYSIILRMQEKNNA